MTPLDYRQKLRDIHKKSFSDDLFDIPKPTKQYVEFIATNAFTQKAVFTVLTTLLFYKTCHPNQDIRYHQKKLDNGFSGRSFDTKYVTPTLKELKLPSMAESGWLTRSLEQPYPYILTYQGEINNPLVKSAFLNILDHVEEKNVIAELTLLYLLNRVNLQIKDNEVIIQPLKNPESLSITRVIDTLQNQFEKDYQTFGGAKLPVLAFYALYELLILEMKRYDGCQLLKLGYSTTCDLTSKSAGDIEIYQGNTLLESLEIKLNKEIDANMVRIAYEKIIKFNPTRYYILSSSSIKESDEEEIFSLVNKIKNEHGCHLILNGLIPTIKYYLRLISSLESFIEKYSLLIATDSELKKPHKAYWNELLLSLSIPDIAT